MSLRENTKRLLEISTLIDKVAEKTGYGDNLIFIMIQEYLNSKIQEVDDERIISRIEGVKVKTSNKKEEIRKAKIELEILERRYKGLAGELGGLKRSISKSKEKIASQDTINDEFRDEKNKLIEEKNKLEEVFSLLQAEATGLRVDLQDLESVIEQLKQQKRELKKKLSESKKEKAVLEYDNTADRRRIYELDNEGEVKLTNLLMYAATIVGILLAIYFFLSK